MSSIKSTWWKMACAVVVLCAATAITSPAQSNPIPLISQPLVPDAVAPGGEGFTLTVNGTGFVFGATVNWNGSPRETAFVTGSQLTASISAADIATAVTDSITVSNPAPGGGVSNAVLFPVTTPISALQFARSDISTGAVEYAVATGDLNNDGKLDLVVSNDLVNTVTVFLGNGDGTFQHSADYATGVEPLAVLLADFNGDGKLDLAVTNYRGVSTSVSVFLGNGDGTFQSPAEYPTATGPEALFAADFNHDGKLDLAVADAYEVGVGNVSILLGNGDGTFQPHVDYPTASYPQQVAASDLNGDGTPDLVVTCLFANRVSVLLGNGDGTFQPHVDYPAGLNPGGLAVADFNGDGRLDLAVGDYGGATLAILLGNGDGTFQAPVSYGVGPVPNQLTAGDFNGDGILDLAVNANDGDVAILLGNGDGTFRKQVHFATGYVPVALATGDFNGDGRLDIVTANAVDLSLSVLIEDATPGASLSATSLTFAPQVVGTTSAAQAVTLTNTGFDTLEITSIIVGGDFLERNTCGSTLAVAASCTISVQFRPSVVGTRTGAVTITDSATGSPQTVSLSGSGTFLSVSLTSLNFGDVSKGQTSPPQTVTLTNFAKTSQSVSIRISGGNSGEFAQTNTCGTTLAPGASCSISVTFTAKFKGAASSSLVVSGGGGPNLSVSLSGTGVS
jgi:FG-GAP-like repeat/Cep192 domain 4/FG-GAP repeat